MSEIAIASPSLPQSLVLFGDIEAHNDFLIENGFDGGLELHPMRRITRLSRNLAELAQTNGDQSVTERFTADNVGRSAHQSFIRRAEKAERQDLVESSMQELDVFINHPEKIEATTTGQMIKQIHEATKGKMR